MSSSRPSSPTLLQQCAAEFVGTFLLVALGCGVVHSAVLTGAQSGLWQVAIVWGIAIMLASYVVGGISGAHINPAITLALAGWRRCGWGCVGPYVVAQLAGAFVAAALLSVLFGGFLVEKERQAGVRRGEPGSIITAMCYGEYFPNPGPLADRNERLTEADIAQFRVRVSHGAAFMAELLGTAILALVVFAVTDPRNTGRPLVGTAPVFIGLTVSALISVIAPLTQACFNPARDLGPRLFAYLAGWGAVAWPGWHDLGWLTVYIVAPLAGALAGASLYELLLRPGMPGPKVP